MKRAVFTFQKLSDFGVGNPAVPRLMLAPSNWLKCFNIEKAKADKVADVYFNGVARHAAACFKVSVEVAAEMETEEAKFSDRCLEARRANREPHEFPSLVNLVTRVENFLDHAQSCLLEATKAVDHLIMPLPCARNYKSILEYLGSRLPKDDRVVVHIDAHKVVLKRISQLRNAARHPEGIDGVLTIRNYSRKKNAPLEFNRPTWNLNEEPFEDLRQVMHEISELIISFAEVLLIECLDGRFESSLPLAFRYIPPEHRDKKMPYAFEVVAHFDGHWVPFSAG